MAANAMQSAAGYSAEYEDISNNLTDLYYNLRDCAENISDALDSLEHDPQRLEEIEERLDLINRLTRKYNCLADELPALAEKMQARLDELIHYDENRSELSAACKTAKKEAEAAAEVLSDKRRATAKEFAEKVKLFRNELCSRTGYKRLTDTYNQDEYRMGVFITEFSVTGKFNNTAGVFDVEFNCKPQRFLISGEWQTAINTSSATITNPTNFSSKPLISFTGTGTLGISDWILTITGLSSQVLYIDCDMMEVYKNTGGIIEGANSLVSINKNTFPELVSGVNNITKTSGLTNLKITPRWWRI